MHALVPQFILDNDRGGNWRGSFPAASLFVDCSGFTALTESLMAHDQDGAEVLAQVVHATLAPLIQCVFEHGGWVSTQEGDAFTALFPAAEGEDESVRRAVTAAIQIQQSALKQASQVTPYGQYTIQVKIGLAFGEAAWTILHSKDGKRAVFYFRGSAVDRCAAAEQLARPGEIVLDGEIWVRIQDCTRTQPRDGFYLLLGYDGVLTPACALPLPPSDLETACRYYPSPLLSWSGGGEFRQVAILFVHLPTIRTEAQLEIFMQTLFSLQDRFGGVLDRVSFGDKGPHLVLFWGAPVARENDMQRLLNFILELQAQTAIPINGGVTYRMAHTGFIGSEQAESFSPFGRGTNLAARLMTSAPRGEIWLDAQAAQRAGSGFVVEEAGRHLFKGFEQAQLVYVLLERKDQPEQRSKEALLDRETELRQLEAFAAPILAGGNMGVLLLQGEPGIGKSSLAYALRGRLEETAGRTFQFVLAQSDEILRQPLNPFRGWLRQAFQVTEGMGEIRNKRNFNRKVEELIAATPDARLAEELDRTRSFLGALLDLYWPDSLYEQLDARGRFENIQLALVAFLQAESLRQPILFLLEDAHWLDDDTRAFLPGLLHALSAGDRAYPVALLVTRRIEGPALDLNKAPIQEVNLDRLSRQGLSSLAESRLGGPISLSLLDLLDERSEGNPFFCEQILQYLQEEGQLVQQEDGWQVKDAGLRTLPVDVGSLLVARLDRLPQEVKGAIQNAAVLGREFDLPLLAGLLLDPIKLSDLVARCEAEKIWTRLNETSYSFQHALLRDAAYRMQSRRGRQALHRRALEAYLAYYTSNLKDHYGELAYHAEQGGLEEQALEYLEQAGFTAQEAYLNRLAESYFSRALHLLPPDRLEKRFELLLGREAAFEMQGKIEARRQDLDELEKLADLLADAHKTLDFTLRKVIFKLNTGAYPEAKRLALQAVDMAEDLDAPEKAVAAYKVLANACLRQSQYSEAITVTQKGLDLAEKIGYKRQVIFLWNMLGLIAYEQLNVDQARSNFERSLELARQSGRLDELAPPLMNLGMVTGAQGNYGAQRVYYEQTLELVHKIGDRRNEGLVLGNLGWTLGAIGEYSQARAYSEEFRRISREVGDPFGEMYSLINLSAYAIFQGDLASAESCAREATHLARKLGERSAEAWALTYLGHCCKETARLEDAVSAYLAAIQIRTELGQPVLALEPQAGLAVCKLEMKEIQAAQELVEGILAHLAQGSLDGTEEPLRIFLACRRVLQAAGDPRAGEVLERGWRFLQARAGAIQEEETRRMFLENNPVHREFTAEWNRRC